MRRRGKGPGTEVRAARALGLGLVALVSAVGCGVGDDVGDAGRPPDVGSHLHQPANFDPSIPGFVACSSTLLVGDVVRVVDGRPGRMVATLAVDTWVKPSTGPDRARLSLVDIAKDGVNDRWAPGTHLRLAVDVDPSMLPSWQFSAAEFAAFEQAVPRAAGLSCPYEPR